MATSTLGKSAAANAPMTGEEKKVIFASSLGTVFEWYDFYLYGSLAAIIAKQFFSGLDAGSAFIFALLAFAAGFIVRPFGALVFGRLGDMIGRKYTFLVTILIMGLSTFIVGILPNYASIGVAAPVILIALRMLQGLALGGEYGGAATYVAEHAPMGKRGAYTAWIQTTATLGLFLSLIVILLAREYTGKDFDVWGWRIPFIASAALVVVGLYVRLKIEETPVFQQTLDRQERVEVPMFVVFRQHAIPLVLGTIIAIATFVLFYLTTVFALTWGTTKLGYNREEFLMIQLGAIFFFALTIPISALLADRLGRRFMLIAVTIGIILYGFLFAPLFGSGETTSVFIFLAIGLALMGMTYGPIGTMLSELFPTSVRYTGSSLTFNLAGIFGASLAPYIAMWLATNYGLPWVGYYLSGSAVLTLAGILATRETRDSDIG